MENDIWIVKTIAVTNSMYLIIQERHSTTLRSPDPTECMTGWSRRWNKDMVAEILRNDSRKEKVTL